MNAHLASRTSQEASLALTRGWQNWGPGKAGPPASPHSMPSGHLPLARPSRASFQSPGAQHLRLLMFSLVTALLAHSDADSQWRPR